MLKRYVFLFSCLLVCSCAQVHDLNVDFYSGRVQQCSTLSSAAQCPCTAGFTDSFLCKACTSAKYKSSYANSQCVDCPPNTLSLPAASNNKQCICRKGFFKSPISLQCIPCPAGTYKPFLSDGACYECPQNSTSTNLKNDHITACLCAAGAQPSASGCQNCPAGTFKSDTANKACTSCDENEISAPGSVSVSACKCVVGFERLPSGKCAACQLGYFKNWHGDENCAPCGANSFTNVRGSNVCKTCAEGLQSPSASTSQEQCVCAAGKKKTFSMQSLNFECSNCETGKYTNTANAHSVCTPCPVSSTTILSGSATADACVCMPGYEFANGACVACIAGKFKSSTANTACISCSSDSFSAISASICTSCSAHSSSNVNRTACVCEPGYTLQCYHEQCHCAPCLAGTFKDSYGSRACTNCPAGSFSLAGSPSCTLCDSGKFQNTQGATQCVSCLQNSASLPGSNVCQCLSGYNSKLTEVGMICKECRANHFCQNNIEVKCPDNTISLQRSTSITDCKCLEGYILS